MHYSKIYKTSILDGPGVRVSLYVSGCRNHCPGCHNPESWDFCFGKEYTKDTEDKILEILDRDYIAGFSIVGGEPMEEENQAVLVELLRRIKKELPDKNIWCFTGYEFEDLMIHGKKHTKVSMELLSYIDVLVTGRFEIAKRDISDNNRWRGSTNQRVVDVKKSLAENKLIMVKNIPNNN